MTAATTVNVPETLKNIWEEDVFDYMYEDQPYLGLVEKDQSWEGLSQIVTVMYGGMAGRSTNFGTAQQNMSPPKYKKMTIETKDNFALWSVDHKLITLTRSNRGSLVRALAENTEKAMSKFKKSTCWMLWGNGGGAIGRISAFSTVTAADDTITFYDINDVRQLDIDDWCQFSDDDGYYGSAGVHSGAAQVLTIDEDNGKVTFDRSLSAFGVGTTDYVFHEGDYANCLSGVPAYVTLNAPGVSSEPTTIHSMLRTAHPTRLAGSRFTASNLLVIEGIKKALAQGHRRNIKTTHIFAPPEVYNDIENSIQGQKRYVSEKVGTVGYEGLAFTSQGGKIVKVYSDADIRKNAAATTKYVYGLNLDTWKLHTAEEYPMWLNTVANGGQRMTVEQNANASQGRLGGYGQHYSVAAGQNWVLALT